MVGTDEELGVPSSIAWEWLVDEDTIVSNRRRRRGL